MTYEYIASGWINYVESEDMEVPDDWQVYCCEPG